MKNEQLLTNSCLLAGKIMIESGSEAYRAEDTMNRIAKASQFNNVTSYVTVTGIFIDLGNINISRFTQATSRSINLKKIDIVNQLSRDYCNEKISLEELFYSLERADKQTTIFSNSMKIFCASLISLSLMLIMGGTFAYAIPTMIVGAIGYASFLFLNSKIRTPYLDELVASIVIGGGACLFYHWGFVDNIDYILIGAVMTLVPGLSITNAFRDILAGHLLSGVIRGVEALLIAGMIGIGIIVTLKLFGGII